MALVAGSVAIGVLEHEAIAAATAIAIATLPRIGAAAIRMAQLKAQVMWVILLEALGALVLLVFIVWWTMFSGRSKGERSDDERR